MEDQSISIEILPAEKTRSEVDHVIASKTSLPVTKNSQNNIVIYGKPGVLIRKTAILKDKT